ncbi:dihydrofolate reductase family protein [Knoellia sp. S7-12]|uniref:dihydrofolate reductase family protein n=1 Tax=Knoellia sp. S7-12 TaxID=3126698 RepID=UPI003369B7C7
MLGGKVDDSCCAVCQPTDQITADRVSESCESVHGLLVTQQLPICQPKEVRQACRKRAGPARKYVVSTTLEDATWENSSVVGGGADQDVRAQLESLKAEHHLGTTGSATLVRWMLEQGLVDELHLLVHPVVVGSGKKLFADGASVALTLVSSTTFSTGVLHLVYAPAEV